VETDFPVALELRHPMPFHAALQFEIGQTTIQAIESHQFWLKSALFGLLDHLLKVVILARTILGRVVKSKFTRQPALAIRPDQRDQADALYHGMMFSIDQCRLTSTMCEA
jgi:hypothetical protein